MNKFFRLIWSKNLHRIIVVPEVGPARSAAPSARKRRRAEKAKPTALAALAIVALGASGGQVAAQPIGTQLPQGGTITAGQAQIATHAAGVMVIDQSSPRVAIQWDSFDIGAAAKVSFQQPATSSVALNRVTGANPSQIFGKLDANGQVFISNRQGVYFAPGARVDVGGLVATSHTMTDDAFMAGSNTFTREGAGGTVQNDGQLTARDGGYVALLAPQVRNQGVIVARLGTVALAAGDAINLEFDDAGSLVSLRVTQSQIDTLIENRHLIMAPGGRIILSSQTASDLRSEIVRNAGQLEARAINQIGGRVFLGGSTIETTANSQITASTAPATSLRPVLRPGDAQIQVTGQTITLGGQMESTGAKGGTVVIEGDSIAITPSARIDASGTAGGGNVLVGGDWQGGASALRRVFDGPDAMAQATTVDMQRGATILANATQAGDGGTVVLWSDISNPNSITSVQGALFAKGGDDGGDGGQIETSGAWLKTDGVSGSAAAPSGRPGEWLFDPYNIEIITPGSDTNGSFAAGVWSPSGDSSQITNSSINSLLNAGTSVTITTGSGGSQDGNVLVNAGITGTGNADLSITAAGMVTVNSAIDVSGAISITANDIETNSTLAANGDITLTASGLDVVLNAAITNAATSATTMTVKANRNTRLGTNASITATAQMDTQIWADTDADGDGINVMESSGITTQGGDLTFGKSGQTATLGGNSVLVGGDLFLQRSSAQTLSTSGGAINIYGETMVANTSGLTVNSGNGDVTFHGLLNSSNQYSWVDKTGSAGTGSWDAARTEAKNGTAGGGSTGDSYLVTITSRLENSVAGLTAGYQGGWIGAYRANSSAYAWTWADGPESGEHFFTQSGRGGSATSGYYSNFGTGEPNGVLRGTRSSVETVGQFFGTDGEWNDLVHTGIYSATQSSPYNVLGFVRETNLASSPVTVNAGTGTATFAGAVGTAKQLADFSITAGAAQINGGAVSSTGAQTYSAPVIIGADTIFTAQDNDIVFNSTLDSASGGNYDVTTTITPGTTYYWVDWTSKTSTTVSGTITIGSDTINVTYTNNSGRTNGNGNAFYGAQTSGGTNYWTGRAGGAFVGESPFVSSLVANGPATTDIIQLQFAGSQTLTFSKPVENLAFSIVSMNGNGYGFDQDFDIVSYSGLNGASAGFYGGGTMTKAVVNGVYQLNDGGVNSSSDNNHSEPHGTIRFNKAFSELTWNSLSDEVWNAFTVGATGSSESAGQVQFNGAIGGTTALGALTVNGQVTLGAGSTINAESMAVTGLATLGGDITTSGDQTFGSAITLAADIDLTTGANGSITTNTTGTIDGAHALAIATSGTGTVSLQAAIGATTPIAALGINSATSVDLADATVAGQIDVSGTTLELSGDLVTASANGNQSLSGSTAITLTEAIALTTGTGDLSLSTPKVNGANFSGSGKVTITSTGALTLAAGGNSFDGNFMAGSLSSVGTQFDLSGTLSSNTFTGSSETAWLVVNNVSGLTGLTIGNSGLTSNVATGTDWTINGPITIYGGAVTIGGALAATDGGSPAQLDDINIYASGAVTQTGALTADGLGLHGTGSFALNNSANSVVTLAGGSGSEKLGSLSFVNAGALRIGSVNATGITASGDVAISTVQGNLTQSEDIATDSTGTAAITLNAGSGQAAGTSSGGDVLLSADVSTGSNGRILVLSGNIANSTGVATKVGSGSGNFRYNADETTDFSTGSWIDLASSGSIAIFREQPTANVTNMTLAMTYGDALPSVMATGTLNGDGSGFSISGASYATSGNLAASGTDYTITSNLGGLGYNVSGISTGTLAVAAKTISVSGATAVNKVYDGTTSASVTGAGVTGLSGDVLSLSGANATFALADTGTGIAVSTSYSLSGADAANYAISQPSGLSADITPKTVTLTASRAYDGTTDLTGSAVLIGGLIGGQTLSYGGAVASDAHVDTANKYVTALTLTDGTGAASNYQLPDLTQATSGQNTVTITAAQLTPSLSNTSITKTYDGNTTAPTGFSPSYAISGLVGDDAVTLSATSAAFNSPNVTGATSLSIAGLAIDGLTSSSGAAISDYALATTSASKTASITPASLGVTANDDAKFVTQSDTSGFNGVSYAGFVNAEDSTALGGALSIARSNAGTNTADVYRDVLVPSGLTSSNYAITFVPGDFTIVPSDQLLVRMSNATSTYGTATQYAISSVEYSDGTNVVRLDDSSIAGSSVSINSSNKVDVADGSGATAAFTIAPLAAATSGAGNLVAGSYQLGTSGVVTENSANFSNTVTVIGAHQVNTKGVTATASNVQKVYDGTTTATNVSLSLSGKETNDTLTVGGLGNFNSKNAGTGLLYSVFSLALSGDDAGNYHLTGGTSISGNDGQITQRTLVTTYSAMNKTYDGSASATVSASDDRLSGDSFSITQTAEFADKNVGTGKTVNISSISLSGTDASNYAVGSTATTAADITRLASVTWLGGATGNWFDPANWGGGAVPDLANVAQVVIPSGTTVSFDTAGAIAPADASQAVSIDTLGSAGNLIQTNGTLNVGTGGITLGNLTVDGGTLATTGGTQISRYAQTGGTFSSAGAMTSDHFNQTGGAASVSGDLTIAQGFVQGSAGTTAITGNTSITNTSGGLVIGNLSTTGTTVLNSRDGVLSQAVGTAIAATGAATLIASNGQTPATDYGITLTGAGNDFQSTVTTTGQNIAVTDTDDLTVNVTASGTATLSSGGILAATLGVAGNSTLSAADQLTVSGASQDLTTLTTGAASNTTFGSTVVRGDLDTTSTGDIGQSATLTVAGASSLTATGRTVVLNQSANDFTGAVSLNAATGNLRDLNTLELGTVVTSGDMSLQTAGTLNLGTTTVGGDLSATSGNGAIRQTGAARVTGNTSLSAGTGDINLGNTANLFGGTLSAGANDATLVADNSLRLGQISATGTLSATADHDLYLGDAINAAAITLRAINGKIEQTAGALTVTNGPNSFTAAGAVTLVQPGNAINGDVTVTAAASRITGDPASRAVKSAASAAAATIGAARASFAAPRRDPAAFRFRNDTIATGTPTGSGAAALGAGASASAGGLAIQIGDCADGGGASDCAGPSLSPAQ